jgi:hypothetical protein
MRDNQEYEVVIRTHRRFRFRNPQRKQYYAEVQKCLTEHYGPFSWKVRAWRNHWIVRHFLWAWLIWKIIVQLVLDVLLMVVIIGVPIALLVGLGALVGHFMWK